MKPGKLKAQSSKLKKSFKSQAPVRGPGLVDSLGCGPSALGLSVVKKLAPGEKRFGSQLFWAMKATLSLRVTVASLAAFIVVPVITVAEREAAGGAGASSGERDRGSFYLANRAPLAPAAFLKLPIGSIRPKGWLRRQLELEAHGMTGRLPEISKWCKYEDNAWASSEGEGHSGWEELPYWLKGYGDLGYVLKDEKIMKEARRWI